jgi:hypothetical protein
MIKDKNRDPTFPCDFAVNIPSLPLDSVQQSFMILPAFIEG